MSQLVPIDPSKAELIGRAFGGFLQQGRELSLMREYWCPMCADQKHPGCNYCSFTGWKDGIAPFVVDVFDGRKLRR